jgi:hypothetical protein
MMRNKFLPLATKESLKAGMQFITSQPLCAQGMVPQVGKEF